jgi:hypothetical protein
MGESPCDRIIVATVAIGTRSNSTVPIPEGVTVLTRLRGFNDRSLITLLQNAGLPLTFAAEDHPY